MSNNLVPKTYLDNLIKYSNVDADLYNEFYNKVHSPSDINDLDLDQLDVEKLNIIKHLMMRYDASLNAYTQDMESINTKYNKFGKKLLSGLKVAAQAFLITLVVTTLIAAAVFMLPPLLGLAPVVLPPILAGLGFIFVTLPIAGLVISSAVAALAGLIALPLGRNKDLNRKKAEYKEKYGLDDKDVKVGSELADLEDLRKQNIYYSGQVKLFKKNAKLQNENEYLRSQSEQALRDENQVLRDDNQALIDQSKAFFAENESLQSQFNVLNEQHKELKGKFNFLSGECKQLGSQNQALYQENQELQTEIQNIKAECESLKTEKQTSEALIQLLQNQALEDHKSSAAPVHQQASTTVGGGSNFFLGGGGLRSVSSGSQDGIMSAPPISDLDLSEDETVFSSSLKSIGMNRS